MYVCMYVCMYARTYVRTYACSGTSFLYAGNQKPVVTMAIIRISFKCTDSELSLIYESVPTGKLSVRTQTEKSVVLIFKPTRAHLYLPKLQITSYLLLSKNGYV